MSPPAAGGSDLGELLSSTDLPHHEAERLMMHAGRRSRSELYVGSPPDERETAAFRALVERREAGEPLQYIEGTVQFGPLELLIDSRALIPRPETEQLWELATALVAGPSVVVDLGTGSGNLALALKHSFPQADVYGCDVSERTLELARENGGYAGLDVTWAVGDLFAALPRSLLSRVDLMVSNPPYVSEREFGGLPSEVKDHEPYDALVSGRTGTEVLAVIGGSARQWLADGGVVVVEIGETQAEPVVAAFDGFVVEVKQDLAGRDRFVVATKVEEGSEE